MIGRKTNKDTMIERSNALSEEILLILKQLMKGTLLRGS